MTLSQEQQKELHGILLEMLVEFCRVCDENDLKYYLIGGSCLGAIRHNGFIPWDDDIDVGMPRLNFDKFNSLAQSQLKNGLFLQNFRTDPDYYYEFCKIRNSNTTYIESGLSNLNINHGLFIDVFPLDYVPDTVLRKVRFRIQRAMYDNYIKEFYKGKSQNVSIQKKIISFLARIMIKDVTMAKEKRDQLLQLISAKPTPFIANYYGAWAKKEIVPAEFFGVGVQTKFEGLTVRVPNEYDDYLRHVYGDYMQLPPENKRVSHHDCKVIDLHIPYMSYTESGKFADNKGKIRKDKIMKRVITYGIFDLLHYGHINLLRRAKALGDYLIVVLSTDEFNWNEKQKKCYFTYEQRKALLESIRYVDLVIPETCWEQKRTDVHEYHIDTFVMGDDWQGKFDFLKDEGAEVVYLPRTPEISTTQIKNDLTNRGGAILKYKTFVAPASVMRWAA